MIAQRNFSTTEQNKQQWNILMLLSYLRVITVSLFLLPNNLLLPCSFHFFHCQKITLDHIEIIFFVKFTTKKIATKVAFQQQLLVVLPAQGYIPPTQRYMGYQFIMCVFHECHNVSNVRYDLTCDCLLCIGVFGKGMCTESSGSVGWICMVPMCIQGAF